MKNKALLPLVGIILLAMLTVFFWSCDWAKGLFPPMSEAQLPQPENFSPCIADDPCDDDTMGQEMRSFYFTIYRQIQVSKLRSVENYNHAKWGVTGLFFIGTIALLLIYYHKLAKERFDKKYGVDDVSLHDDPTMEILADLEKGVVKYNTAGVIAILFTIMAMIILFVFVYDLFENTISDVNLLHTQGEALAIILIMLRTFLLGSFIITFLVFSFRFLRSSFDQATRFNKRMHALLFLKYLRGESNDTLDKDTIHALMVAFSEWNVNVESAFSEAKSTKNRIPPDKSLDEILKLLQELKNK